MAKTVQVGNVSPMITEPHLREFFGHVGTVVQVKVLPVDLAAGGVRTAFVEFADVADASLALYLTNTTFVDRSFIITAAPDGIPANAEALVAVPVPAPGTVAPAVPTPVSSVPTGMPLPVPVPHPMTGAVAHPSAMGVILVPVVPGTLAVLGPNGVARQPQPPPAVLPPMLNLPPLPLNTDPSKVDEIRRTVYVGNLPATITPEQILQAFSVAGIILFVRIAGEELQSTRFAFIEFDSIQAAANAIPLSGMLIEGRPIKVSHAKNVITKTSPNQARAPTAQEVEETMRKLKEAGQKAKGAAGEDANATDDAKKDSRDRSTSRERKRSRSRSRSRRRHRSRSRSRSRDRRRRERSSDRRRDRSRDRRDRSRGRRDRSRDRKDRDHRDRSRDRGGRSDRRDRDRGSRSDRDRERDKDKKDRRDRSGEREKEKRGEEDNAGSPNSGDDRRPSVPEAAAAMSPSSAPATANAGPNGEEAAPMDM